MVLFVEVRSTSLRKNVEAVLGKTDMFLYSRVRFREISHACRIFLSRDACDESCELRRPVFRTFACIPMFIPCFFPLQNETNGKHKGDTVWLAVTDDGLNILHHRTMVIYLHSYLFKKALLDLVLILKLFYMLKKACWYLRGDWLITWWRRFARSAFRKWRTGASTLTSWRSGAV